MGYFINGDWRPNAEHETSEDDGEFHRDETTFRNWIEADEDADFPAEPGRYHLYIARPCPWAHGAALVRRMTGLTDTISMDVIDPYRAEDGWQFTVEKEGCTPDTINGFDYLRETYVAADPDYAGRVSVPVLWDRERNTIVNNESIEIMRMLNAEFHDFGNGVDLYPAGYQDEIDRIVDEIYTPINNGVYRAGFAESQAAYEAAVEELFEALDRWNAVLAEQRYLAGDRLTLADVRLFPTLIRFDEVYHTLFKCDISRLTDYEHLWAYLRDLYQMPGFAETVDMGHIKEGYYTGSPEINPKGLIAVGPDLNYTSSSDRDRLPGDPPETLQTSQ